MEIPLCKPTIGNEEIQAVSEVLSSGWLAHGEYNHKFEESFCQYLGVNNAISMNSCTSALIAALAALDIDGEVIIPSMTWVSTANAVRIVVSFIGSYLLTKGSVNRAKDYQLNLLRN